MSPDDLDAVHDLYLDARKLPVGSSRYTPNLEAQEVTRRIDRMMGQALLAGQARGTVKRHGQHGGITDARSVLDFVKAGRSADYYRYAELSDDLFERALDNARSKGNIGHQSVMREAKILAQLNPNGKVAPPPRQVVPTPRGRRTLEHLAIQMSAIALGVQEVDPREVDAVAMAEVIEQAFDDIGIIRAYLRKVKKA